MYPTIRPFLFQLDPERAHAFTLSLLRLGGRWPAFSRLVRQMFTAPQKPVDVFGLNFSNPIGLAAGYDKDATAWRGLACLGFGHVEIGTVTPQPQDGNPRPRLFRLHQDGALINRMGFPGQGAQRVADRLRGPKPDGLILGVNLGKNKDTPFDEAAGDYLSLMKVFAPLADYLVINVSSPNTVGLRRLQARQALTALLSQVDTDRRSMSASSDRKVPVLVKLAPDLTDQELDDALDAILSTGMEAVIATNTTIRREMLKSPKASESGGLSGAPLRARSTQMIRKIHTRTNGVLPIVGVGGVLSPADAQEKMDVGAVLVQVFTGLVYSGPGLVQSILKAL